MSNEISHLCGASHLNEILFTPGLHEKNVTHELDAFHPSWSTFLSIYHFHSLVKFLFLF